MAINYAPGEVAINVGGNEIQGKNELSIEPLYDLNTPVADADGRFITVTNAAYNHVRITITLEQTASDNGVLNTLYEANTVVPVGIIDLSGNSTVVCSEARFEKRATMTFAKDATSDRVWTLIGKYQAMVDGGNE